MSRRPRGLTPGERALWEAHARRYRPLPTQRPAPEPAPRTAAAPPVAPPPPGQGAPRIEPFRLGERARAMGSAASPLPPAPPPVDRRANRALARGRARPDARLDLHGLTLDRAHDALMRFVRRAQAEDKRLLLVITGKGRAADDPDPLVRPRGVLRRQVPLWLAQPPLSAMVLGVSPAHRRHGGDGALYVHLRRAAGR